MLREVFRGMGEVAMLYHFLIFLLLSSTWEMNEWMEMEINPSSNTSQEEGGVEEGEDGENKG